MATTTTVPLGVHEKLNRAPSKVGTLIFAGVMILGLIFIGISIARDLADIQLGSMWPYALLGVALGFEFVNGFHDTANAVATVILHAFLGSEHRRGLVVWSARQYHARLILRRGRHDDGQLVRLADEHGAQSAAGLGTDVARGNDALRLPFLHVPATLPRIVRGWPNTAASLAR